MQLPGIRCRYCRGLQCSFPFLFLKVRGGLANNGQPPTQREHTNRTHLHTVTADVLIIILPFAQPPLPINDLLRAAARSCGLKEILPSVSSLPVYFSEFGDHPASRAWQAIFRSGVFLVGLRALRMSIERLSNSPSKSTCFLLYNDIFSDCDCG